MNMPTHRNASWLTYGLAAIALALLVAIYAAPIWWVSLTAPNYPEEAFPDGVRIHFHMNGVFNGCKKIEREEIQESEALDCVHEMDTINHYVGMYPIAAGGPVEKGFSQFLMTLLGLIIIAFVVPQPKARVAVMAVGSVALLGWMYATLYADNGIKLQNTGYVSALIASMDQGKGEDEEEEVGGAQSSAQALIEQLRRSMEESETKAKESTAQDASKSEKERYINSLRITFEKDQERRGTGESWTGSGFQVMSWHYEKSLGRYFNNPAEIKPMVATLKIATHLVFAGIVVALVILVWGARRNGGLIYWLMIIAPLMLPVFFIIEYAAWLWWFGHNLNEMGAFTVKPFMPTVFGDGKVAQFATHSYPYYGFGLMALLSLVLAAVALLRRKALRAGQ